MPTTPASTKNLPLPVRIFRAAMEQQRSLADYAQSLDISADGLRAIVKAQLDHVELGTLDRLAELYQQPRESLREQSPISPTQEVFAAWLRRNMEGISQHALRARVQLDSKTLKQFLNGDMLPDSDQAERLARALYIDRTELARVVTATMIHQADTQRRADTNGTGADQAVPALARTEEPVASRAPRTPRRKGTSHVEQASAEATTTNGGTKTAAKQPQSEPEVDITQRRVARRQASTKTAATPSAPTATPPIEPAPAPEPERARQPAADRQADEPPAAASKRTTTDSVGVVAHRGDPTAAPAEGDVLPTLKTPMQRNTSKPRRPGAEAKPGAADAASPVTIPRKAEAPARQAALEGNPVAEPAMVVGEAAALAQNDLAPSTSPAAKTPRSAPSKASTSAAPAPVTTASVVAADTTTLQLTADEVRLVRRWRQLHPHGRRATLHYIGSLLVED